MDVKIKIHFPENSQFETLLKNYMTARDELQKFLAVDFWDEDIRKDAGGGNHQHQESIIHGS